MYYFADMNYKKSKKNYNEFKQMNGRKNAAQSLNRINH